LIFRASLGTYQINGGNQDCQDGKADGQRYSEVLPNVDAFLRVYTYTTQNIAP